MTSDGAGLKVGDIIADKYRIDRIIGRGGMGVVFGAHHLQLDETVAIKVLLPEALADESATQRFEREARAAAKIKSEHVARVHDLGKLPGGAPYIVMELLEGEDLGARLGRLGPLPIEQIAERMLQACEALAEAHALGIVHRDLKPENLFVVKRRDGSEVTKILDFGISKALSSQTMTRTANLVGSPLYMSPEQLKTPKLVDHRTDIWSLGVVLYELATGEAPFSAESLPELALRIVDDQLPTMSQRSFAVPPFFEAITRLCLAKRREDRYQSVAELAADLAQYAPLQGRSTVERTRAILGLPPVSAPSEAPEAKQQAKHHESRVSGERKRSTPGSTMASTMASAGTREPETRKSATASAPPASSAPASDRTIVMEPTSPTRPAPASGRDADSARASSAAAPHDTASHRGTAQSWNVSGSHQAPLRRSSGLIVAVVGVLAVGAVLVVLRVMRRDTTPSPTTATTEEPSRPEATQAASAQPEEIAHEPAASAEAPASAPPEHASAVPASLGSSPAPPPAAPKPAAAPAPPSTRRDPLDRLYGERE
jgi:serine/threonine-protein kinase